MQRGDGSDLEHRLACMAEYYMECMPEVQRVPGVAARPWHASGSVACAGDVPLCLSGN
jgi:hypothetical protein